MHAVATSGRRSLMTLSTVCQVSAPSWCNYRITWAAIVMTACCSAGIGDIVECCTGADSAFSLNRISSVGQNNAVSTSSVTDVSGISNGIVAVITDNGSTTIKVNVVTGTDGVNISCVTSLSRICGLIMTSITIKAIRILPETIGQI